MHVKESNKRRQVMRRNVLENEFGEPLCHDEEPPVEYTLSVSDLESDDNTSRESSSESEIEMSTENAPDDLGASLSYPLSVQRIGGQAVERDQLRE